MAGWYNEEEEEFTMIYQKIQKVGDNYIITIPREEVERQQLEDGLLVSVEIQRADEIDPEIRRVFEASWEHNKAGYLYLKDR